MIAPGPATPMRRRARRGERRRARCGGRDEKAMMSFWVGSHSLRVYQTGRIITSSNWPSTNSPLLSASLSFAKYSGSPRP